MIKMVFFSGSKSVIFVNFFFISFKQEMHIYWEIVIENKQFKETEIL